jgi:hypothetical protein
VIKVHNETSSSIRRTDRGCSFAHALSYFRKNLVDHFDSVPSRVHPRAWWNGKRLTKLYKSCRWQRVIRRIRWIVPPPPHRTIGPAPHKRRTWENSRNGALSGSK